MTDELKPCREAFEEWFFPHREKCRENNILLDTNDANSMWEGWQAAWNTRAHPPATSEDTGHAVSMQRVNIAPGVDVFMTAGQRAAWREHVGRPTSADAPERYWLIEQTDLDEDDDHRVIHTTDPDCYPGAKILGEYVLKSRTVDIEALKLEVDAELCGFWGRNALYETNKRSVHEAIDHLTQHYDITEKRK